MPLRIDPRLPLVWRSPDSLQLGVDRAVVVLESISNAEERMLAALVGGTTRTGLVLVAESAHATSDDADALLRRLAPALVPVTPSHQLGDVVVTGIGAVAERLRYVLDERGLLEREVSTRTRPDLAVIVTQFVVDPADRARWLSLDVPHLAVLLGDREAQFGPIVEPGTTPCLHCLELHRRDADPAWTAISSQLWKRHSAIDTPLFAGEVTSHVMRLIESRLADGASARSDSTVIDAVTGERSFREWAIHPDCGCAVPPGSGLGRDHRFVADLATTTGSGALELA